MWAHSFLLFERSLKINLTIATIIITATIRSPKVSRKPIPPLTIATIAMSAATKSTAAIIVSVIILVTILSYKPVKISRKQKKKVKKSIEIVSNNINVN